jgi:hypothetical protein
MKRDVICFVLFVGIFSLVTSCVESGYGWDSINKEGAFSHENGISVKIGNFDTIRFNTVESSVVVNIEYIKDVEDLFSEEMYDYFVFDNKGRDEALGDISFEADFIANISNPAEKEFSDFELSTAILKENGEDTGIIIEDQTFKTAKEEQTFNDPQPFIAKIRKEDVLKLKEAYILRLTFVFSGKKVEWDDYVLIENINLKLGGGFSISL